MIEKRISLENLTKDTVAIEERKVYVEDGKEYPIGNLPMRTLHLNNERGRLAVKEQLDNAHQTAVFALWGDKPTLTEDYTTNAGENIEG